MTASSLNSLFGMEGEIAVVIGATGVLGGALAEGIAAAGAHVVVCGRSAERGESRVETIRSAGGSASFRSVDVTSRDSIQALSDTVLAEHGRIDSLVNCAGVNFAGPYAELEDKDFDRVWETNLRSTHICCQVLGGAMVASGNGGAILNIGSVSSHRPLSRVFAYSASKAAVVNLSQNLAREWATEGVRVNVLCPGFFPAEQNRKILTPERTADILNHTPMGRFGEPEELVGAALLLLARRAGSFITGHALYVDGGFTSMTI